MGKARYMYNNLAEAASLAISSVVAGRVSSVAPQKTGSAVLVAQGPYTGQEGRAYTVQIDSVSPGNEIGQATFRWRRDDSASWEASGQATSASLVSQDNGVQIRWNAGAGDDFALYDLWNFLAEQVHSPAALVDGDPKIGRAHV